MFHMNPVKNIIIQKLIMLNTASSLMTSKKLISIELQDIIPLFHVHCIVIFEMNTRLEKKWILNEFPISSSSIHVQDNNIIDRQN